MSIPIDIDTNVPVRAHHEIDIDAPLEIIWRLHTDVNNWPTWQTDSTAARLDEHSSPVLPSNGRVTALPSSQPFTW